MQRQDDLDLVVHALHAGDVLRRDAQGGLLSLVEHLAFEGNDTFGDLDVTASPQFRPASSASSAFLVNVAGWRSLTRVNGAEIDPNQCPIVGKAGK